VKHVPVLIVGAGAGGLATSALLAKHAVASLVVERRRETFIYPKARNLSFRTLEILRGLGLGDQVHAVADGYSGMVVKPRLNSPDESPAIDISEMFSALEGLTPEPAMQYCPQSRLEPILLGEIRRRGSDVRYGTELTSFEQDRTGVTAVLRDMESGEFEAVQADYLVAADGVHSRIRATLGVNTTGHGALPIYVVFVYFRAPWRQLVAPPLRDGDAVHVKNDSVDAIIVPADADLGMFITSYLPDEGETAAQFTPHRCRELILDAVGERIELEILEVATWQPNELVADEFNCGRVFFVGDSAHAMPPFKAGGANVAIQSAHNLAWKLAAVLAGSAGPSLLATYHAERHPVGRFSARQSLTGPTVALLRLGAKAPQLPANEEVPMFALLAGYQYQSSAVVADDPGHDGPHGVRLVEELQGQPGTRVPHVWVGRGARTVSTLDLLGSGFTLLSRGGREWRAAAAAVSAALGVPIDVHCVGSDGDVVDLDGCWGSATRLAPDGALLVRPDDFVGWRAQELPTDPAKALHTALAEILSRPGPSGE
jgi:putative polyketide hydroxylase